MATVDQYGNPSAAGGYGSSEHSEHGRNPLSISLGFLKSLTEKKSTRVDGQPLKRRGPKPDSKPALTRRQELNRQAQRTHRERKELYIKALEQEVLRLKENFSIVTRTKDSLAEENRRLKELLAAHGIPWNGSGGVEELSRMAGNGNSSTSYPSSLSYPTSTAQSLSPQPPTGSGHISPLPRGALHPPQFTQTLDYEQTGIDFVLTYAPDPQPNPVPPGPR